MMKPLVSILLLLLAIAKTTMGHVRRARSNLTDIVDVKNNDGCPLCTCDTAASDDTIEASVLMLDVQVSC